MRTACEPAVTIVLPERREAASPSIVAAYAGARDDDDARQPAAPPRSGRFATAGSSRCSPSGWTGWAGSTACSPRRCRSTRWSRCGSTPWCSTWRSSGRRRGTYLEKLCARAPAARRRRLHRPVERRPARPRAAAGRRRLGHQAVPPGGADRPRRGRRAAPQARRGARRRPRRSPIGELEIRADQFQAFVGGASVDLTRREFELIQLLADAEGQVLAARGDLRARLGLRDGPRRPLGRRLRAQAAPEAREGLAGLALHPHALRHRLPLRGGAGGGVRSRRPSPADAAGARRPRPTAPEPTSCRPDARAIVRAVGPDRGTHLRNIAIVILLAVIVWQLPGGGHRRRRRSATCWGSSSSAACCSSATGMYMENRDTIFGLDERQRGILYAAVALAAITLVATQRMWDEGGARRRALARLHQRSPSGGCTASGAPTASTERVPTGRRPRRRRARCRSRRGAPVSTRIGRGRGCRRPGRAAARDRRASRCRCRRAAGR